MGNSIIVQSGGPTAVINNSIVGLLDEIDLTNRKEKVFGAVSSIDGLITGNYVDLTNMSYDERNKLRWTPGAALGTCRYKVTEVDIEKMFANFEKNDIRFVFYIGGNGSMQVAKMMHNYARKTDRNVSVIGIPKSIDNDLEVTDHSPGYGSAAKFLATSILDIKMDVASYQRDSRVTIIETMGRHTGWLAAASALTNDKNDEGKTLIYIPEIPFHLSDCLEEIDKTLKERRDIFLVLSEGIKDERGKLINEKEVTYDALNRPRLGGVSEYVRNEISKELGINTRKVSPSVWQRSSILLASKTDVNEAYEVGRRAWQVAQEGYCGVMITIDRKTSEDTSYDVTYDFTPLIHVASKEKRVPTSWYDKAQNTMTDTFIRYIEPLIKGEMIIPMEKGLPTYQKVI